MCWLIGNVFFLFFIFQCSDYWCGLTKVYGQAVHRYIIRLPLTKNRIDEGTFLNAGSTPLHMPQQLQQISYLSQRKQMLSCRSKGNFQCSDYNVPNSWEQYTINSFGFCCIFFSSCTLYKPQLLSSLVFFFLFFSTSLCPLKFLVSAFKKPERKAFLFVEES